MAGAFQTDAFQTDTFQADAGVTATTRLNARWFNFTERGQHWTHFWQDIGDATRANSDTLTVSDSLVRAAAVKTRTLSDTLTISESVSGAKRLPRTLSDTLVTSDSLSRSTISHARTLSDTLTTSDSLVRTTVLHKTLSDTITSLTATVVGLKIKPRTLSDTLTISDSLLGVSKLHQFKADAIIKGPISPSFTAQAIIAGGGGGSYWGGSGHGGGGGGGSSSPTPVPTITAKITIDGVDVTPRVKFATANFTSTVNGTPGTCSFEIVDLAHSFLPITGKRVNLYIDNFLYWAGYATRAVRVYGFPVDDTVHANKTERLFRIEGVDVNILFQKRIVYNKTTPSKGQLPPPAAYRCSPGRPDEWAGNTQADVVVPYLMSHYTDLPADGVTFNVSSNFGSPEPDRCFAFTGAMTAGAMMTDLNRLLQGVWYIDQNFVMHFHDTETATSLYTLVDDPEKYGVSPTNVPPRELMFLSDGSRMINDAMVWGTAQGYKKITFARVTDNLDTNGASSVTDHGLWQYGEFNGSVYKQATVNKIANSLVYGVTQNQQGARWDRVVVTATVFQPLFQLGDVVHCISDAFTGLMGSPYDAPGGNKVGTGALSINLPIRRIEVTFPTPSHAKFALTMSREIDDPYSAFEFIFPHIGGTPPIVPPNIPPVLPPVDCGITDDFERTVTGDTWGTASSGFIWLMNSSSLSPIAWVDGHNGLLRASIDSFTSAALSFNATPFTTSSLVSYTVSTGDMTEGHSFIFGSVAVSVQINTTGGVSTLVLAWNDGITSASTSTPLPILGTVRHQVDCSLSGGVWSVRVWAVGSTRPSAPTLSLAVPSTVVNIDGYSAFTASTGADEALYMEYLDIKGVNGCSALPFDEFNRTVPPNGLGVADGGFTWNLTFYNYGGGGQPVPAIQVDGSRLVMTSTSPLGNDIFKYTTSFGIPSMSGQTDFSVVGRFMVDSLYFNNVPLISLESVDSNFGFYVSITNNVNNGITGWANGEYGFPGQTGTLPKLDWIAGAWYLIKYSLLNGVENITLWQDGTAEPAPQISKLSNNNHRTAGPWELEVWNNNDIGDNVNHQVNIYIDWIRTQNGVSLVPPEPLPPNTFGCTQVYPVGTVAPLGQSFVIGSERVYLNGILQRYGTDYTTDPPNGLIIFVVAPPSSDQVYICFGSAQ